MEVFHSGQVQLKGVPLQCLGEAYATTSGFLAKFYLCLRTDKDALRVCTQAAVSTDPGGSHGDSTVAPSRVETPSIIKQHPPAPSESWSRPSISPFLVTQEQRQHLQMLKLNPANIV